MMEWLRPLEDLASQGVDSQLVVAVEREGSTPGASGAGMLVTEEGRVFGTIGGGQMELHCEKQAMELLRQRKSGLEHLGLHPEGEGDLGMICGGDVTVWYQFLPGSRLPQDAGEGPLCLLLEQDGEGCGQAHLCKLSSQPEKRLPRVGGRLTALPEGGYRYVERMEDPTDVYIFGAGHVAQALVPGLAKTGFRCHIYDDRAEYAVAANFPQGTQVVPVDMGHLEEICAQIGQEDFICVMTHGHRYDYEVVCQVLRTPAAYIGVIGSSKKAAATRERLHQERFTQQDIDRIVTPIGLAIGAETPEEIAVSILAQLIQKRAKMLGSEKVK